MDIKLTQSQIDIISEAKMFGAFEGCVRYILRYATLEELEEIEIVCKQELRKAREYREQNL